MISAGISAASQYYQTRTVNWVEVAIAAISGGIGAHGGLWWNTLVNSAGGAAGTAINNVMHDKNDGVIESGILSGAFGAIGYGGGLIAANTIKSSIKPTINNSNSWVRTNAWSNSGYNIFNSNNTAVINASLIGGTMQESIKNSTENMLQSEDGK